MTAPSSPRHEARLDLGVERSRRFCPSPSLESPVSVARLRLFVPSDHSRIDAAPLVSPRMVRAKTWACRKGHALINL